ALIGEKYGDEVRVVKFGDSNEFCGGTHVSATGKIGMVRILSESSVAAGVRRIEAITGEKVEEMIDEVQDTINALKALFNNAPDLEGTITKYIEENAGLKKQVEEYMKEKISAIKTTLKSKIEERNGVNVIKALLPIPAAAAKDIAFQLKGELTNDVFIVIGSVENDRPMLTVMISEDLVKSGLHAGQLVREAAKLIQGGGGGQPHFATAGGKNTEGLSAAVDKVLELANL
ncbi:MAG: alanine--tRNA ligase, partial [Phocaeicola sp.]|nr:alanine--tRNA ligase [Phocaeicola sp.]